MKRSKPSHKTTKHKKTTLHWPFFLLRFMVLLALLWVSNTILVAQTTRWNGSQSSDWFDAGNWDSGVPGSGDEARITWISTGNHWPVIDGVVNIRRLFMQSNNNQLTILSGSELHVVEDVSISNSSTLNAGNALMTVGTNFSSQGTVTWEAGEIEVGGNFTTSGNSTSFNFGNADVSVGGNFTTTGVSTFGTGTLEVDGAFSIGNAQTFNLLGGSIIVHSESSLGGNLNIDQGGSFTINAPFTVGGSSNLNLIDGNIIINDNFNMTSGTFVIEDGSVSFLGDTSIGGNGVIDAGSADLLFDGALSMASGILNLDQANVTVSGNSSFSGNGVFNMGSSNINFEGNIQLSGNPTFNPELSTVTLNGTSELTVSNNIDGNTIFFYDLIVAEGANITANSNVFVINDMIVEEGGYFIIGDGLTINIVGNVTGYPDVDTNRPYIVTLFIIDDTTIKAVFNESLTPATAENTANYRIDDAVFNASQIGAITGAELVGANNNEVILELSLSNASGIIEQGEAYFLVANNIESLQGRQVSSNHRKRFGYPNFQDLILRYYPGGLDKTNLQLWLDAADDRFLFTDLSGQHKAGDEDPVAFWADKSGNNRNALQSNNDFMPVLTYYIAIGGRPSLAFNNAEFFEFDGSFVAGSDYSIASLVARGSSRRFNVYLGGTGTGTNNNLHLFWRLNDRLNHHHFGNDYWSVVPPFDGSLAGEIHIMELRQAVSPNRRMWQNGALLSTRNSHHSINSWDGSAIGRYINAADPEDHNYRFEGYVAEMIMHNKSLSETERIIIENYKAAKWGQELATAVKKFEAPEGFGFQLAGIGRESAADLVEETVYTSGGLGFANSLPGFLNHDGNYMMAAHNNATGVDSSPYFTTEHIIIKWTRAWYVEQTVPGNDGQLTVYFDFEDYDLPAPEPAADYMIIYHPSDPDFPPASTTTLDVTSSTAGTKVSFTLSSEDMANGYYTFGEYVAPAVVDPGETTISAVPTIIEADGLSKSLITVQARYFTGDPLPTGGDTVVLLTTAGTLSAVTDNGDGTYTAILTSAASEGTAEITGTINDELIDDSATVVFKIGAANAQHTTIAADPVYILADGVTTSLITVQARDQNGDVTNSGGDSVVLITTAGTLSNITDHNNGTYTALLTSETIAQMAIISGTINAAPINDHAVVHFVPGPADPDNTTLFAFPETITADGLSTSTIIVQAIDAFGNSLTVGGDAVVINTTAGTLSSVTDNGNGIYTAFLTSSETVETANISATINGSDISETATVNFVDYIVLNYYPGGLDNSRLQLWLDSADPDVMFTDIEGNNPAAAGDRIGHWRDKSIFSRHATQETFAWKPVWDATGGFGQRPSLLFNNAEFMLFDGSFVANTNYTISTVVTRTSVKNYNIILGGTEIGENNNLHLFWSNNNELHYHHYDNNMNVLVPPYDGSQVGEMHIFRYSGSDEAPARQLFWNGIFMGSRANITAINEWQGAAIGRYMPQGGDYFAGRMAELIMHDYAITNTERIIIANYTAARWGYPLDEEVTFFDAPTGFDRQMVGIGRYSAADRVTETVFTSGGLGFRTTLADFLAGINNYLMAAHNGGTGTANELILVGDEYLDRWQRIWYLQKTAPNGDGHVWLYFNRFDYEENYPNKRDNFFLLYNPDDPEFPAATTTVIDGEAIVDGVEIRFGLHSSQLNDGYYTLGRLSRGITYYSRASGSWSNPDTWSLVSHTGSAAGQIPGEDDQAIIAANHVVTLVENVTNETGTILVGNTGTLVTNQNVIAGGGRFVLEPNGTLHVSSTSGIRAFAMDGNIQTSIRNFSTQANYVYDGTELQQTGDGLPALVHDLRINNYMGVNAVASHVVNGRLRLDNGLFSMPPGSSLVANDVEQTNGNLRMQLTIDGGKGWRMITSPVQTNWADLLDGFVSQGFGGSSFPAKQPNVLWFDETEVGTTNMAWRAPGNISDPITGGRGYFHYVFNGAEMSENGNPTGVFYDDALPIAMDATGLEYATGTGAFDFGITHTHRSESTITDTDIPEMNTGWNLISNPSTASLDWDNASGWTKVNIDETIYIWDPAASNGEGDFRFWNGSTGTLENGLIAPFQSFWVRANNENPSLAMNGNAKTTGGTFVGNSFSGKSQPYYVPTSLMLTLEAGGMETHAMLSFTENGKLGEDPGDAYRLEPLGNNWLKLFTTVSEHHLPMVINNLPAYFDEQLVIPLYYEGQRQAMPVAGEHRLSWRMPENWPMHWETVLMDHANKKVIPMDKATNAISFNINQAHSGTSASETVGYPLAMPGRIVSAQPENTQHDLQISTGGIGASSGDHITPKTSSIQLAPAFSIVIFPGDQPENIEYMPIKPALLSVFPNPARYNANIRFSMPETAYVSFSMYDIFGRRVHKIAGQSYSPGVHRIHWPVENLKSGVYVIVMYCGDVSDSEKLIVQ